jgi:hypothetical protein
MGAMQKFGFSLCLGLALISQGCVAHVAVTFVSCVDDNARYANRAAELQKLVQEDQDDRRDWQNALNDSRAVENLQFRDESRRRRVGEIFGEGCFKSDDDFSAAALVFQHGNTSDHYYQAFIWFRRAFELGDQRQRRMIGTALDRYLVRIGYKQLFATQASLVTGTKCWCLEQVEPTFPDAKRIENDNFSTERALEWIKDLNKNQPECLSHQCTQKPLKDTPVGTVIGVW